MKVFISQALQKFLRHFHIMIKIVIKGTHGTSVSNKTDILLK